MAFLLKKETTNSGFMKFLAILFKNNVNLQFQIEAKQVKGAVGLIKNTTGALGSTVFVLDEYVKHLSVSLVLQLENLVVGKRAPLVLLDLVIGFVKEGVYRRRALYRTVGEQPNTVIDQWVRGPSSVTLPEFTLQSARLR